MNQYAQLAALREEKIDDAGPWVCVGSDSVGWEGVKKDWIESHKKTYLEHITDWTVCVQAGGCMGVHPRLFSDMFARVYTFEPDPLNFFCLTLNCQKNNIIKMQAALGHENKLITINVPDGDNTGTKTINDTHKLIPMLTLDSFNLDACSFIQLDVEYYELNVLKGAIKTIEKYKPVISCELGFITYFDRVKQQGLSHGGNLLHDNTLEADLLKLLKPFGYKRVAKTAADVIFKVV
jgi:FkbM family methyltransferase